MSNGRLRSSRRTYLLPILLPSHSTGITNSRIPSTGSCSTRRLPRRGSSTTIRIRIMRSPRTSGSATLGRPGRSRCTSGAARGPRIPTSTTLCRRSQRKKNGTAASIASRETRKGGLRVYLKRGWFSSGDDEKLAVILPLGHYADIPDFLRDRVTEWGADPIWKSETLPPRPILENFPSAAEHIPQYRGDGRRSQTAGDSRWGLLHRAEDRRCRHRCLRRPPRRREKSSLCRSGHRRQSLLFSLHPPRPVSLSTLLLALPRVVAACPRRLHPTNSRAHLDGQARGARSLLDCPDRSELCRGAWSGWSTADL